MNMTLRCLAAGPAAVFVSMAVAQTPPPPPAPPAAPAVAAPAPPPAVPAAPPPPPAQEPTQKVGKETKLAMGKVKGKSLGEMIQLLWQTVELQAIHIDALRQKVDDAA